MSLAWVSGSRAAEFSGTSQAVEALIDQGKDQTREDVKRESRDMNRTEKPCAERFGTTRMSEYEAGGSHSRKGCEGHLSSNDF